MDTSIRQLEKKLWWHCVQEHAAKDQEMVERWHTDDLVHLRERYTVSPMPNSLRPLVEKAMAQWREREKTICSHLKMTPEEFVDEFKKAREQFLESDDEWLLFVSRTGHVVYGAVLNSFHP